MAVAAATDFAIDRLEQGDGGRALIHGMTSNRYNKVKHHSKNLWKQAGRTLRPWARGLRDVGKLFGFGKYNLPHGWRSKIGYFGKGQYDVPYSGQGLYSGRGLYDKVVNNYGYRKGNKRSIKKRAHKSSKSGRRYKSSKSYHSSQYYDKKANAYVRKAARAGKRAGDKARASSLASDVPLSMLSQPSDGYSATPLRSMSGQKRSELSPGLMSPSQSLSQDSPASKFYKFPYLPDSLGHDADLL